MKQKLKYEAEINNLKSEKVQMNQTIADQVNHSTKIDESNTINPTKIKVKP